MHRTTCIYLSIWNLEHHLELYNVNVAESEHIDIVSWHAIQYKRLSNSGAIALLFRGIWTKISNDLPTHCRVPNVFQHVCCGQCPQRTTENVIEPFKN